MAVININAVRLIQVVLEEIMMISSQIEARASHALWVKSQFFFLPLKILVLVPDNGLPCMLLQLFAFVVGTLQLVFRGEVAASQEDAGESASKCA